MSEKWSKTSPILKNDEDPSKTAKFLEKSLKFKKYRGTTNWSD
jgi:hypothetical protein